MFAYCGDNPTNLVDSNGHAGGLLAVIITVIICALCLSGCGAKSSSKSAINTAMPTPSPRPTPASLTLDQKVLIATIAAEGAVNAHGEPVSSSARQAMANVALNRVGSREWKEYTTVSEICQYTGFDGYGSINYNSCMEYLNNRDGQNEMYESIIWDVMQAYESDITQGCQLYYTPADMSPPGSKPNWNFSLLVEVSIPGVDPYYEGTFYRYG